MIHQEFIEALQQQMTHLVAPGQKVTIQTIEKNNGTSYQGLVIIDPVLNISPTIYLEPFYQKHLKGTSLDHICEEIFQLYQKFSPTEDFDETLFTDYEKAKHRIIMKLVNREKNHSLLEKVPHIPYLDLAIVFVCSAGDLEKEYATILIHDNHMEHWGIDLTTLYNVAKENTPRLLPPHFENMEDFLVRCCAWPYSEHIPMYLLTNHLKIQGAATILYDGFLEQLSEELDSSLAIIPSSVHEVLIIPVASKKELDNYTPMIMEVNATQLTADEVLSDHPYYYSKKYHVLS